MGDIHPSVKLGPGVIIGDDVKIGANCTIGAYSIFSGPTEIGENNEFWPHTIIGADPQDKKWKGGGTLKIGNGNRFREQVSVHRGHLSDHGTMIGDNNYFFTGVHVGHDCVIGNDSIFVNNVLLAGHCEVGDGANIAGGVAFHQFVKIGGKTMISGLAAVHQDVYPYSLVEGTPARHIGVNLIGLKRMGYDADKRHQIKTAFRLIRKGLKEAPEPNPYFDELMAFKKASSRGVCAFARRKS